VSQKIADRAERIAQILLDIHSRWKRPLHVPPHRLCQGLLQECGITVAKLHLDLGAVDYLVPAKQRLCGSRSKACRQHVEHSLPQYLRASLSSGCPVRGATDSIVGRRRHRVTRPDATGIEGRFKNRPYRDTTNPTPPPFPRRRKYGDRFDVAPGDAEATRDASLPVNLGAPPADREGAGVLELCQPAQNGDRGRTCTLVMGFPVRCPVFSHLSDDSLCIWGS